MKFVLEVDLEKGAMPDATAEELGRILRYWAGALKQLELNEETQQGIYDSRYAEVGSWRITA